MNRISTEELRELEIINVCGGESLGYPCEFEIDLDDASILAIVSEEKRGAFSLFSDREKHVIPWKCVECIGKDTILVRIDSKEINDCNTCRCKNKRHKCK